MEHPPVNALTAVIRSEGTTQKFSYRGGARIGHRTGNDLIVLRTFGRRNFRAFDQLAVHPMARLTEITSPERKAQI